MSLLTQCFSPTCLVAIGARIVVAADLLSCPGNATASATLQEYHPTGPKTAKNSTIASGIPLWLQSDYGKSRLAKSANFPQAAMGARGVARFVSFPF